MKPPFNHRRTPLYKAVKAFVWLFLKPYDVVRTSYTYNKNEDGLITEYSEEYSVIINGKIVFRYNDGSYCFAKDNCREWSFENLSISGKVIKD